MVRTWLSLGTAVVVVVFALPVVTRSNLCLDFSFLFCFLLTLCFCQKQKVDNNILTFIPKKKKVSVSIYLYIKSIYLSIYIYIYIYIKGSFLSHPAATWAWNKGQMRTRGILFFIRLITCFVIVVSVNLFNGPDFVSQKYTGFLLFYKQVHGFPDHIVS